MKGLVGYVWPYLNFQVRQSRHRKGSQPHFSINPCLKRIGVAGVGDVNGTPGGSA